MQTPDQLQAIVAALPEDQPVPLGLAQALAASSNDMSRLWAAIRTDDPQLLTELARDPQASVRAGVARNNATPYDVRADLLRQGGAPAWAAAVTWTDPPAEELYAFLNEGWLDMSKNSEPAVPQDIPAYLGARVVELIAENGSASMLKALGQRLVEEPELAATARRVLEHRAKNIPHMYSTDAVDAITAFSLLEVEADLPDHLGTYGYDSKPLLAWWNDPENFNPTGVGESWSVFRAIGPVLAGRRLAGAAAWPELRPFLLANPRVDLATRLSWLEDNKDRAFPAYLVEELAKQVVDSFGAGSPQSGKALTALVERWDATDPYTVFEMDMFADPQAWSVLIKTGGPLVISRALSSPELPLEVLWDAPLAFAFAQGGSRLVLLLGPTLDAQGWQTLTDMSRNVQASLREAVDLLYDLGQTKNPVRLNVREGNQGRTGISV